MNARDAESLYSRCSYFFGHPPQRAKARLLEAADGLHDERPDRYGTGELLERVEKRVADLLGKESAVFMPGGIMAQQAALRAHADRNRINTVALHPRSHLYESEAGAFEILHPLRGIPIGSRVAMFTIDDLRAVTEPIGTLLMELPDRNLGGTLRPWDELDEIVTWARERGIRVHLDGARLWESAPYYGRSFAEIASLFDTVYVSMYKVLNAIAGAVLAGPAEIVNEARTWQIRHGGRLFQQFPMAITAWQGLERYLPRVPLYVKRAGSIASQLHAFDGVRVVPDPPPTNMMHVYVRGDHERLSEAALAASAETKLWLRSAFQQTAVPGWSMFEIHCSEGSLALDDAVLRATFERLLERLG